MNGRRSTSSALTAPVASGARRLVARAIANVSEEAGRLDDPADLQAVHDFRVAVRRLRTYLQAYAPALGIDEGNQLRIRELTATTNSTRDREAEAEWLETLLAAAELDTAERDALEALRLRIRSSITRPPDLAATARRTLSDVAGAVAAASDSMDFGREPDAETFGLVTSNVVRREARRLRKRLGRIRSIEDSRAIHRARLSQKRLRYVLEPFEAGEPTVKRALRRLRTLQDTLGELHDLSRLSGRTDHASGRLRSLIEDRRNRLFASLLSDWIAEERGEFFADIDRICEVLVSTDE